MIIILNFTENSVLLIELMVQLPQIGYPFDR